MIDYIPGRPQNFTHRKIKVLSENYPTFLKFAGYFVNKNQSFAGKFYVLIRAVRRRHKKF